MPKMGSPYKQSNLSTVEYRGQRITTRKGGQPRASNHLVTEAGVQK